MNQTTLLNALCLAAPLLFPTLALAATSAPEATQPRQGMAAREHAEHGESAGAGGAVVKGGIPGGRGKPMAWTAFPILKIKMGGEGRERRVVTVIPQGIAANGIDAYSNDIKDAKGHRQLPLDMAGARLDKPEAGGFHWLAAREEQDGEVRVASTVYFFSNPGKNPTAMFMQQKHELEIIPQPFPREHSRYRAGENWKFLVRFNSKPLVNQKVDLQTQNDTKAGLVSDMQGMISVHLPDDFKPEAEQKNADRHSPGRRGSDFVLATKYAEGGKTYLTGFNGNYGPDAFDQRSLAMGLGFTFLGMIGAVPLLRQRKAMKKSADAGQTADAPVIPETSKNKEA